MDSYGISFADLVQLLDNNNKLVASEALDSGAGHFDVKIPGLIKDIDDLLNLPVKVDGKDVVLFKDVAVGRFAYKDRKNSARMNGKPAVTLEIKKRIGSNIIETIDEVKEVINQVQPYWPAGVDVGLAQDESKS